MKQYLLNPDGSFPPNIDPERLVELGITPVLPTPRHVPAEGMVLEEGEPVQDEQGMWRQVWNEVPAPPPEPVPVPESVSRFQARAALKRYGALDSVKALMASMPEDDERRMAWEDAQEFRRTSPTVLAMGAALGLDDAALDQLFIMAAGIEA